MSANPRREYDRASDQLGLFIDAMATELDANAWKGGWQGFSRRRHFYELDYHLAKLKAAVRAGDEPERILEFAADLANHAMFLVDTEQVLTPECVVSRAKEPSFLKPRLGVYLRLIVNPRWTRKGWGGLFNPVDHESHPIPEEPRAGWYS